MTSVGEVTTLLALGRAFAEGRHERSGISGPRGACLLARQALELVVVQLLSARRLKVGDSRMRTRLICLRQAYAADPDLVYRAETTWWRLSVACHHHAFELDPTPAQALALIDDVAALESAGRRLLSARLPDSAALAVGS